MKLSRSDYFQGILQLRNINEEILSFVHNQIKKRGDVAVTRTVKYSNGIDLYITSQKFIRILGKKLKDSFGGELKISSKLHTRNKQGKDLYRVNALFKPSKYRKGDLVSVRGDEVRLISIGKKIFARNLKTGKKVTIRSNDLLRD
jgi:NMD protein affecting ribosome stability and mRNA decay